MSTPKITRISVTISECIIRHIQNHGNHPSVIYLSKGAMKWLTTEYSHWVNTPSDINSINGIPVTILDTEEVWVGTR